MHAKGFGEENSRDEYISDGSDYIFFEFVSTPHNYCDIAKGTHEILTIQYTVRISIFIKSAVWEQKLIF